MVNQESDSSSLSNQLFSVTLEAFPIVVVFVVVTAVVRSAITSRKSKRVDSIASSDDDGDVNDSNDASDDVIDGHCGTDLKDDGRDVKPEPGEESKKVL